MRHKPKRKPKKKPKLDDELIELASVIAEVQLENNARGWFEMPWRSGWNAARLVVALWHLERIELANAGRRAQSTPSGFDDLADVLASEDIDAITASYEDLEDLRVQLTASGDRTLAQAPRFLQMMIAGTSGRGANYNAMLIRLFERSSVATPTLADIVRVHRCRDAIGVAHNLDTNDARRKRAFEIAWDRGLYRAAYALCTEGSIKEPQG